MLDPHNSSSAVLRREHRIIERVLAVLEQLVARAEDGQGFELAALQRCVEFFRLFADACHHAKEEDLLFPALEAQGVPRDGGPIGVMLYEHTIARQLTREMHEALAAHEQGQPDAAAHFCKAAHAYLNLLTNHIHKEDNVLFNIGDNVLSEEACARLCTAYGEVGCRSFGGRRREELERIADELEQWTLG